MKHIKSYEKTYQEIYGILPGENVIIKDEELQNILKTSDNIEELELLLVTDKYNL